MTNQQTWVVHTLEYLGHLVGKEITLLYTQICIFVCAKLHRWRFEMRTLESLNTKHSSRDTSTVERRFEIAIRGKRRERDQSRVTRRNLQNVIAALKVVLSDLRVEALALGKGVLSDANLFTSRSRDLRKTQEDLQLRRWVVILEENLDKIEKERRAFEILLFMQTREEELHSKLLSKINNFISYNYCQNIKTRKLQRNVSMSHLQMMDAKHGLENTTEQTAADSILWRKSLIGSQKQEEYADNFENMVYHVLKKQSPPCPSQTLTSSQARDESKSSLVQKIKSIMRYKHLDLTLKQTLQSEKVFENAFRRIGECVGVANIDPNAIMQRCLHHNDVRREISLRSAQEKIRNDTYKRQLSLLENSLDNAFYESNRVSNRHVQESETKLSDTLKRVEASNGEFRYVQNQCQPILIGLRNLTKRILGMETRLSRDEHFSFVLEAVNVGVEHLAKTVSLLENAVKTGNTFAYGCKHEKRKLSRKLERNYYSFTPSSWETMESSLSPNNVRVHTFYHGFGVDKSSSEIGSTEDVNQDNRYGHREELNFNVINSETEEYFDSQIRNETKKASMQFVRNTTRKKSRSKLKVESQHEANERLFRHNENNHCKLHF